ncbi:MAG: M3 family metallopeptidase [Woeseiaceae bacterium]
MTDRAIFLLFASALLAACGQQEPAADASLPVRYAEVSLAELASAEQLAARCAEEEAQFREHFATLESYSGPTTVEGYYRSWDSLRSSIGTISSFAASLSKVHPDADLRSAGEECQQLLTKVTTDMGLSRALYDGVSRIDLLGTSDETRFSVERALLKFRLSGVDKDDATRDQIRALNDEILLVGQEFDRNIREDVRYIELESAEDLEGLPEDYVASHQPNEDGKILVSTQYPDAFPFFEYAESDEARKKLSLEYRSRGYPQNEDKLRRLIELRYELAQKVGFNNYAELITADKMSGSPERVNEFLKELNSYISDVQDSEYDVLLTRLQQDRPDAELIEPWQRSFVTSKVQREQYDVDSKVTRQYFGYNDALDGIMTLVQEMFGVRIEPWETETWHEDVHGYELYDGDDVIGRFYLDMHPREGKFQHAAMFPFVRGIEGRQIPVAALVCNFPAGDERMQFSQVVTFLHEFGHLIHWQFAGHEDWSNTSGIATEWDFVEAPSQMLQEWVWDYATVSKFARSPDGEVLPEDLHARMVAARDFGIGINTGFQLSFAALSMSMYDRPPSEVDFDELTVETARKYTRFEPIEGSHRWASFGHLNGYSAIYYTYQWSLAIATDMFTVFQENGLNNFEIAGAYRDKVLARGGSAPARELVEDFLGREISFEPYADRLRGTNSTE